MRALVAIVAALFALGPVSGAAGEFVGKARVIDGDTLDIGGVRIRLHGIDAPEAKQTCKVGGQRWGCGAEATRALKKATKGRSVRCNERDRDRYGRIVAVCYAGSDDLNAWMVSQGWALAYRRYSMDYVDEEADAKAAGAGMWRGDFVPPWEWRHK